MQHFSPVGGPGSNSLVLALMAENPQGPALETRGVGQKPSCKYFWIQVSPVLKQSGPKEWKLLTSFLGDGQDQNADLPQRFVDFKEKFVD